MFIHEMSEAECRKALQHAAIGRLACARDNQPYVFPIYFTLEGEYAYAFTTLGQKIEWMRTNPTVCLEVDERVGHDRWQSIMVFGEYEELKDQPKYEAARMKALKLLQKQPMWWEPAYIGAKHRETSHSEIPIFYRIRIIRMTGHRATADAVDSTELNKEQSKGGDGWWSEILRHIGIHD